jgi:hypothetical protein
MFLKCGTRKKDGKEHRSWSVVESRRVGRGAGQRHVLYLGEINDSQCAAWQKAVDVFDEQAGQTRQCALFPADRTPPVTATRRRPGTAPGAAHRTGPGRGAPAGPAEPDPATPTTPAHHRHQNELSRGAL